MSSELRIRYATGYDVYAVVLDSSVYAWSTVDSEFVPLTDADWADCANTLDEIGATGVYAGNMPACTTGAYSLLFFRMAGEGAASTDRDIGAGEIDWDGEAETRPVTYSQLLARTLAAASYSQCTDDSIKTHLEQDGTKLDNVWDLTEESGGLRQLTAAALATVRTATGLASANLDTQFDEVLAAITTALATVRGSDSDTLKTLKDALTSGIDITRTFLTSQGDNIYSEGS